MQKADLSKPPTSQEILDDLEETSPYSAVLTKAERAAMLERKLARLPIEKIPRRKYYDLFEFRCR